MLAKFRQKYPQGSLVSELIKIDRGEYIVQAAVKIDNIVLASALASANTVEAADDAAKLRAIAALFLDNDTAPNQPEHISTLPSPPKLPDPPLAEQTVSETKIVDFAKPQSEVSQQANNVSQVQDVTVASIVEPPETLLKFESENENSSPATAEENNLFGDTFKVETPDPASSPNTNSNNAADELEAMHFNDIKQKTDIEIRRLGWSKDQGKEFLMSHYGKRSRLHLTDEQLLEFLRYLEKLPNPVK